MLTWQKPNLQTMKITRLEIKDFQQFKDFELDLTYPAGHKLAGEPLRKVCFIGQSGTGKTTILDFIANIILWQTSIKNIDENMYSNSSFLGKCRIHYNNIDFDKTWEKRTSQYQPYSSVYISNILPEEVNTEKLKYYFDNHKPNFHENQKTILIYFPVGISNHNLDIDRAEDKRNYIDSNFISSRKYAFFNYEEAQSIWKELHDNIAKYNEEATNYSMQMVNAAKKDNKIDVGKEVLKWETKNLNPLIEIAEKCLNPMLAHFNLRIKTTIDKVSEIQYVQVENFEGKTIPYEKLSTGTKQIFLTAFSLYQLTVKKEQALQKDIIENKGFPTQEALQMLLKENPIILFDEPENSLYPDIQRILIDYYTNIAPDAQFFFATHSPLIASQFEPWEVVELGFDENGKVQRRKYYEGENHVDNYTIFPQYLRWDSILTRSFGVSYSGNDDREDLLPKTLRLKKQLAQMEEKGLNNTADYHDKMKTFIENAKKLGWTEELRTFYEKDK